MSINNTTTKTIKKKVPFTIRKGLQNLISWKQLYTIKGTKNKKAADLIDLQIATYKEKHGLD